MQTNERAEDADRQVALRIARLRGGRGDRLEPQVGEEQDRRGAHDAGPTECEPALVRRHERLPVARVNRTHANRDHDDQHRDLHDDEEGVDAGRLPHAGAEDGRHRRNREHGDEIQREPGRRADERRREHGRDDDVEIPQQAGQVAREPDRERRGRERVLEHQDPAQSPGKHFPERRIAVAVGRTGYRHRGGELGVAQRRQRASRSREHERDHDRGTREVRGGGARQDVNTGAEDAADAEQDEMHRAEGAPQPVRSGLCL